MAWPTTRTLSRTFRKIETHTHTLTHMPRVEIFSISRHVSLGSPSVCARPSRYLTTVVQLRRFEFLSILERGVAPKPVLSAHAAAYDDDGDSARGGKVAFGPQVSPGGQSGSRGGHHGGRCVSRRKA